MPAARAVARVLAHRGASAWWPEHTLAAYRQAILDGADLIEPDLVSTRDGVLVARHENQLAETTDVAQHAEFADRFCHKTIDGVAQSGWFTEDFSLAELKRLRARERIPHIRPGNAVHDGTLEIPSWNEIVDLVRDFDARTGRCVGVVPELKHSSHFRSLGLGLEAAFLRALPDYPADRSRHPLIIQSFEISNLRWLRETLGQAAGMQLMQLVLTEPDAMPADQVGRAAPICQAHMLTPSGMGQIAAYADILAPWTRTLAPWDAEERLGPANDLITQAHDCGLEVHAWTFRPENCFLPAQFRSRAGPHARNPAGSLAEISHFLALGIDGLFTDDPALGRAACG